MRWAIVGAVAVSAALVAWGWRSRPSREASAPPWGDGWADLVDVVVVPVSVPTLGVGAARLMVTPRSGYFVYSDGIEVSPPADAPIRLGAPELPVGEMVPGDEPGHMRMKYVDPFAIAVPVDASSTVDGLYHVPLDARFRLCSPHGCQPVRTGKLELVVAVGDAGSSTPE